MTLTAAADGSSLGNPGPAGWAAIVGTAMLLTAQPLSVLNPMTALIRATASLKPEAMTSPGAAAVDSLINLAWVTVFAISLLQTVRRR